MRLSTLGHAFLCVVCILLCGITKECGFNSVAFALGIIAVIPAFCAFMTYLEPPPRYK